MKNLNFLKSFIPLLLFSLIISGCSKQKMAINKIEGEWEVKVFDFGNYNQLQEVTQLNLEFKDYNIKESTTGECDWDLTFENGFRRSVPQKYYFDEEGENITLFIFGLKVDMQTTIEDDELRLNGVFFEYEERYSISLFAVRI
ncbi:MAG: hypothetical protein JEZ03_17855 [Bacteroidales bacterium]|nr:hypothetical protein [Bacteroidales bacterium]